MFPIPFDEKLHSLQDLPIAAYLRREMNDPLIFSYRHTRTMNFVIAAWVNQPRGEMIELAIFRPGMESRDIVTSIKSLRPNTPEFERQKKENRATLAQMERRQEAADEEAQRTDEDCDRFLNRRFTKHGNGRVVVPAFQEEREAEKAAENERKALVGSVTKERMERSARLVGVD